ncbi:poly(ethylene terephthalate) hydrolase family protein [Anaeromicropila herbilytica]|uniref:PET hydrolase/cutinase-like domain-containing protein n=1 Tax=Anaeromicropila herbilytica TaxID=2785025 RepID=A0A7R7EN78_9FIRM|nr:alpha/beta hydrolase [Anaeromicropila herbilytica]BCN31670.1 hypothetical protein bsdtb5_29650 [Anaeromicropila herbilytica]
MKIIKKLLKIILIIILVIILLSIVVWRIFVYKSNHYYNFSKTKQTVEKTYTALGSYDVSFKEFKAGDDIIKKYEIWYPSELKANDSKYPVVVIANGTGVPASSYKAFFKHLASWGFIVVGNEDENSRTGASSESSLVFLMEQNEDSSSIFYRKVDKDNIGIGGHSQGGVGAINAVTSQEHGSMYKALYAVSATSPYWGQKNVFGLEWSYDLSKVNIPTFLAAGTGYFDAGTAKISLQRTDRVSVRCGHLRLTMMHFRILSLKSLQERRVSITVKHIRRLTDI